MVDFDKHTGKGLRKSIRELRVAIPSLGRANKMRIVTRLPDVIRDQAVILCHDFEEDAYRRAAETHGFRILALPGTPEFMGTANVRRWIFEHCSKEKVAMLDDDIQFYVRRPGEARLINASDDEVIKMFAAVSRKLDTHPHVAISAREGNNRGPDGWVDNTRMLRFLAYDVPTVLSVIAERKFIEVREDFDISLQLLRAGWPNSVSYHWAQGQPGTQAVGGCSEYRTLEMQDRSAHELVAAHPGFVSIRQKKNKTGGEFGSRTEVTIYWKKAYDSSPE